MQLAKYLLETASKNYGTNRPTCQGVKIASKRKCNIQNVGCSCFGETKLKSQRSKIRRGKRK
jgi:hypothetical protein